MLLYGVAGNPASEINYPQNLVFPNSSKIFENIKVLSSVDSRVTGYPGFYFAKEYIIGRLKKLNITVIEEKYNIAVPISETGELRILDTSSKQYVLRLYPLLPNSIAPSVANKTLHDIIYIGDGRLKYLEGMDLHNKVVLMDFNCGNRWIYPVSLGAEAIIFIEPDNTTRFEALKKTLNIPVNIPRLWIKRSDAEKILKILNNITIVNIKSKISYKNVEGSNIIAIINGTDKRDEIIILTAYYDSWSIVPEISPGADEAIAPSLMLTLADFFAKHRPRRTVILLFLGSHHQALGGARAFISEYIFEKQIIPADKVKLVVNLDLSSETDSLAILYTGYYSYLAKRSILERLNWLYQKLRFYKDNIEKKLNLRFKVHFGDSEREWMSFAPHLFSLDSEPFTMAGAPAITIYTDSSLRIFRETPFDTYDRIVKENVLRQSLFITSLLASIVNEESIDTPTWNPSRYNGGLGIGFAKIVGQVREYNTTSGEYEPVGNAIIKVFPMQAGPEEERTEVFYNHEIVTFSDSNGIFVVDGLIPDCSKVTPYIIEAYVLDSNGNIIYSPDSGIHSSNYPNILRIDRGVLGDIKNPRIVVVFKSKEIIVFDVVNPQDLETSHNLEIALYEYGSKNPPLSFYVAMDYHGVAAVFVPSDKTITLDVRLSGDKYPRAIIVNSSSINPLGYGIRVSKEYPLELYNTVLLYVNDLYSINEYRLLKLNKVGIFSNNTKALYDLSRYHLDKAKESLRLHNIGDFLVSIYKAWNYGYYTYSDLRSIEDEAIYSIIGFFVMLIPFAILFERLVFHIDNRKIRSLLTVLVFSIFGLLLYIVHPGFHIGINIIVVLLGFTVIVLALPVIGIVLSKALGYIKEYRERTLGRRFEKVDILTSLQFGFSLAVLNMRRRRLQSTLIIVSFIIMISSAVFLVSILGLKVTMMPTRNVKTLYTGLLVERGTGLRLLPLSSRLLDILEYISYKNNLQLDFRVWAYPPLQKIVVHSDNGKECIIRGILGLSINTYKLIENFERRSGLKVIEGKWFRSNKAFECIISDYVANELNVKIGDYIILAGLKYKVIGIFSSKLFYQITDLDGEPIVPYDLSVKTRAHLIPSFVIILPVENVLMYWSQPDYPYYLFSGARVYQIAYFTLYDAQSTGIAKSLSDLTNVEIYVRSGNNTVTKVEQLKLISVSGVQTLIIPYLILILVLLNIMLDNVYGRKREITIYSSLGMNPSHVASLFLTEGVTFGLLSAIIGYVLGIYLSKLLVHLGMLPKWLSPTYSSVAILYEVLLAISISILSTVYPMIIAGKAVTPSFERTWKVPKPVKGVWRITFPLRISDKEVDYIINYLLSYLKKSSTKYVSKYTVDEVKIEKTPSGRLIIFSSRLAPYEAGIKQTVKILFRKVEDKWYISMELRKITGPERAWRNSNVKLIDDIRKAFLVWRTLSPEDRARYASGD